MFADSADHCTNIEKHIILASPIPASAVAIALLLHSFLSCVMDHCAVSTALLISEIYVLI
jgi:hypothetical protein